ncbi:MAG: SMP-30/gluconolactonase/LRE family protein, partial [Acetobacteraceae bacterium]|nr:SMP-30/gluconolactonase/LRE family protein [Acetobacteraceae bacterium]
MPAEPVWTGRALLGEGPVWSLSRGEVLFTDIKGGRLIAWSPATGDAREWPVAGNLCWLVERRDGDGFVAGLRNRIVHLRLHADRGCDIAVDLGQPEAHLPGNRFNDGKADPAGRIWFGSMDDAEVAISGALYRLDRDGTIERVDTGYGVANGPALSPDGSVLYHADSAARSIYAFDIGPNGDLSGKRVHLRFGEQDGYPDGMTVDAEGGLWVAHWEGGRVTRFGPDGKPERWVSLPVSRVTSVAFFGSGLNRIA